MNNRARQTAAEKELRQVCSRVPDAVRASWTQKDYADEIKRQNPAIGKWLANKAGAESFFRQQKLIDAPTRFIHQPYQEPESLEEIVKQRQREWQPIRGELTPMKLHKAQLNIETEYQRNSINPLRVEKIAAGFDLVVFGALLIANRKGAGTYYIVDGQNRWMAAQRRGEIDEVLCNVFDSESIEHEARVFAAVNMARAGVTPADKHRALVTAKEPVALWLDEMLEVLGIEVVPGGSKAPNQLSAIGLVYGMALRDRQRCEVVMSLVQELTSEYKIDGDLIKALDYLDRRIDGGVENQILRVRLKKIGCHKVMEAIAIARSANTGVRQIGAAVLGEVNKGLSESRKLVLLEV